MARILCIEDEAPLRRVIAAEMRDAGYEVVEAANGDEGLKAILDLRPDLVLCDVNMPGMSGFDVLATLRAQHPEQGAMPFVFLSALADRKDKIAGISLGADDYLTKPVDFDALLLTVAARLNQMARIGERIDQERRVAAEQLHQARYRDALTGLPNRSSLIESIELLIAAEGGARLLLVDLDRFSGVNLVLGREHADDVLRTLAERLAQIAPAGTLIARIGDDRFALSLPPAEDLEALAERLRQGCAEPCRIGERQLFLTVSVGVAAARNEAPSAEGLIGDVEAALHEAKRAGGNVVRIFDPALAVRDIEQIEMEIALRDALAAGEFELHFQPKISLTTRRPVGMEALVRWNSPTLGRVSPARFIPVAEESGLILPLGAFVLRQACTRMKQWLERGFDPAMQIAVNLSVRQMRDSRLIAEIAAVLEETALPAANLVLEITESGLVEEGDQSLIGTLGALRALGLSLSIDDFGTGYSALSYLSRLPVQELKIDQSFIRGLPATAGNRTIVLAVIAMAQGLGLKLVAEGVETEAQAAFLRARGCDVIQGYLLARPMPAAEFETFCIDNGVLGD